MIYDPQHIHLQNLLKTEVGRRIEETTDDLRRKQGVTKNFYMFLDEVFKAKAAEMREVGGKKELLTTSMSKTFLNALGENLKAEVLEVILRIMARSIENRSAYSNDMLHIAFDYEVNRKGRLPKETWLFGIIKETILKILSDTENKKDWYWMQNYLLQSSIWYEKVNPNELKSKILWYEVFEWVDAETKTQSAIVGKTMKEIEEKNEEEWKQFSQYNIETNYQFENVRQDVIPRGLKAEYTKDHLIQNVSLSADFNPMVHYDLSQYLSQLILVCHEADDKFQRDIQRIFSVDKETKKNKELGLQYKRGPVKKLERCYAKCQSDYREMAFPTAAHVLDIIRCSLIFNDVSSMLKGMNLFKKEMESGDYCIREVVRVKNGFNTFSFDNAEYTDIKFNVMVKGKDHNIIGEMQFLFKEMFEYKKIAHSLYSIERTQEFVDNMTKILDIKLDLTKQLFIHASRDNYKGFSDLMVTNDFKPKDLLQLNQRNQSILTPICAVNAPRALSYLVKLIEHDEVIKALIKKRLVFPDSDGNYPLRLAVEKNHYYGVLRSIVDGDKLELANYKSPTHIAHYCWSNKSAKSAMLILRNISRQKRHKLILKEYTLENLLTVGDAELMRFVWDQLRTNQKAKEKWLSRRDNYNEGKWSNLHDACKLGCVQGGSVECVKAVLSFYGDDEKEQESLWTKQDNMLMNPLFLAASCASYNILDWRLQQMDETEKTAFFTSAEYWGKEPIDILISNRHHHTRGNKNDLKALKIMVSHLNSSFENKFPELFLFAAKNNAVETAELLLEKTSSKEKREKIIAYKSKARNTALHFAAQKNHVEFVDFLLKIIDVDHPMLTAKNDEARNALMEAADKSALRITKAILEKVKDEKAILKKMLTMKCDSKQLPINYAIRSSHKNSERCAKIIISYYSADSDVEEIFLPCLRLGDVELAKELWARTKGNKELQKKMLEATNDNRRNCFLLVSKNGHYDCLKWLLSLNNDSAEEAKEDEKNLMKKDGQSRNALLLVASNDVRKISEDKKEEKNLSDEEKRKKKKKREDYFKCGQLILEAITDENKTTVLKETDNDNSNALMWCCANANMQGAKFILDNCGDDKTREAIIDQKDYSGYNCFHKAIQGGNMDLIFMIHDLYKSFKKEEELIKGQKALQVAFREGRMEVVEWILFDLITDAKKRMEFLNGTISNCKSGRKTEEAAKRMATRILEEDLEDMKEDKDIKEQKEIYNVHRVFDFMMKKDDVYSLKLILDRLSPEEDTKKNWFNTVGCLSYATRNRAYLLRELLAYLGDYYDPLLDSQPNALVNAIEHRSEECVSMLFAHIDSQDIKDQLIATKDIKSNALISCVKQKNAALVELLVANHSDIEPLLGASFRSCLTSDNIDAARVLLEQSNDKSSILNEKGPQNYNVLLYALQRQTDECLKFIVAELEDDHESQSNPLKGGYGGRRDRSHSFSSSASGAASPSIQGSDYHSDFDDEDEMKGLPLSADQDEDSRIHKMYFMTTDSKENIFHILMQSPEGAQSQLAVLERVLSKEQIQKMLSTPNQDDKLPLHVISDTIDPEVLQWILDEQFEDDMAVKYFKFNMIAARNKFGNSNWSTFGANVPLQEFFGSKLIEYMKDVNFKKKDIIERTPLIDFITVKEIFRYTLKWRNPKIQKLILEKVDEEKHPELLSTENIDRNQSIAVDLIDVDDLAMAEAVLPAIQNQLMFMYYSGTATPLIRGLGNSKGQNSMQSMLDAMTDPVIKYRFLTESGYSKGNYAPLWFGYRYTDPLLPMMEAEMKGDEYTAHILNISMLENADGKGFVKAALDRIASDEERQRMLRMVNPAGVTMFGRAVNSQYDKLEKGELLQWFLDDVIKTNEDAVYHLTTPSVRTLSNPLSSLVDRTSTTSIFVECMKRLTPQQRIDQLLFKTYENRSILSSTSSKDFRDTLAQIMAEALNEIKEPINDFETLWALFTFCFDELKDDVKYLDLVLSKAPDDMRPKLICHYEDNRSHNAIWKMLGRGNEQEDKDVMALLLKFVDESQKMDLLNDKPNPERKEVRDYESALVRVIERGDTEKFEMIKKMFAESKQDFEEQLTAIDSTGEPLLFKAIQSGEETICEEILKAIGSDAAKMKVFNVRKKSNRSNIFSNASRNGLVKKTIDTILENIKVNKLKSDSFIPYFQWLVGNNDLESIKALFEALKHEKNAVPRFMASRWQDKRNVIALSCTSDSKVEMLEFFLPKLRDKDLRKMLLNRNMSNSITLNDASQKCQDIILKHVKDKDPELLKELLIEDDRAIVRGHVGDKEKLVEIFAYCDGRVLTEEVINKLLSLNGWSEGETRDEIRAVIMAKGKEVGVTDQRMYLHVEPSSGNIPLFECLTNGNGKLFDTIKGVIGLDDKDTLEYLIAYRNYRNENLLHGACRMSSDRLKYCQTVLEDMCQFQAERESLLMAKNNDGNNPMQLFLSNVSSYSSSKIKEENQLLMDYFLGIIKRDDVRQQFLMEPNISGTSVLSYFVSNIGGFPDGIKVYKEKILKPIKSSDEQDIPLWANLLHITLHNINSEKEMIEIVKLIVNKFDHLQLQIKLLKHADRGTKFRNVFDVMSRSYITGRRRLWEYFLKFIDTHVHNEVLIKPDKDGSSPLFRLIDDEGRDIEAHLLMEKFEGKKANLLMMRDFEQKTLLGKASRTLMAKSLSLIGEQLPQFVIDNIDGYRSSKYFLFNFIQEQVELRDDLLHQLLFKVKRRSDGASMVSILVKMSNDMESVTNWIWPYLLKLDADQIETLLAQTDDDGDTLMTVCSKYCKSLNVFEKVLALYPNDDSKKQAILHQNYDGKNAFDHAVVNSELVYQADRFWNMRAEDDSLLFTDEERLQLINTQLYQWHSSPNAHWRRWIKALLKGMDVVNDVKLLAPLWHIATSRYDLDFAALILSKVDRTSSEKVTEFLTIKFGYKLQNTVLHYAANVSQDRVEMLQMLLSLAEDAKVSVADILLDPDQRNLNYPNPFMLAVGKNHHKICSLILSLFSSKKEKQKLLMINKIVDRTVNYKNWFNREEHEIRRNVVVEALGNVADSTDYYRETIRMPLVRELVESLDDIEALLQYENAAEESIYHYLITKEVCEYFQSMKVLTFNVKSWSIKDVNGRTPFMKALQVSGDRSKIAFIDWIFTNCCKNTEEKLKLVYQYDNDGVLALEKVSGTVLHFLIQFVKSKCTYKSMKDLDKLIPLYLYALKHSNLELAKWTLSLLKNAADRRKLVNCNDDLGLNTVFAAIKSSSMRTLKFVLNHKEFAENLVFNTDQAGLSSLHYAMKTGNIGIFQEVLSMYERNEKGNFKTLIFNTKDNAGNNPFALAIKEGVGFSSLRKWILNELGNDYVAKMELLFSKNKSGEVPLIASYQSSVELETAHDEIYEYFTKKKIVNAGNAVLAGRALHFLAKFNAQSTMKMIIDAVEDEMVLNKVLSVKNNTNISIIYRLQQYQRWNCLEWFLSEVVPNDHPCLFSPSKHSGNTALKQILQDKKIKIAEMLLMKITDNDKKQKLLNARTHAGSNGDESALDWAQKRNIKPMVQWLKEQIGDDQ